MPEKETAIAAELSWPQVHAFRLQRHHLMQRAPKKDLARVVADIGGAQAQVMSAAELQIAVRVDCTVEDVRKAQVHPLPARQALSPEDRFAAFAWAV